MVGRGTSGAPILDVDDLPADVRRQLEKQTGKKLRRPRKPMPKDRVRSHAIRVLAVVAELSLSDRRRVLEHALKLNEV